MHEILAGIAGFVIGMAMLSLCWCDAMNNSIKAGVYVHQAVAYKIVAMNSEAGEKKGRDV